MDACKLNAVTIPNYEGAPSIRELLANRRRIKIMPSIDLRSSFWHFPLKQECNDYTEFLNKAITY